MLSTPSKIQKFQSGPLISAGIFSWNTLAEIHHSTFDKPVLCPLLPPVGGGGLLSYMGYIGVCRCEGYGFRAVYSSIGCVNQSVWV